VDVNVLLFIIEKVIQGLLLGFVEVVIGEVHLRKVV
jgi:hypothetical protein